MLNYNELPDVMYFSSSKKILELKNKVFLTPHIGLASLLIINPDDLFPKGYSTSCNISYRQWNFSNDLLAEPLKTVNVRHNIVAFENKKFEGQSSGYIHVVDVSKVKNMLSVYVTNNPDREVVYNGEDTLPIIKIIPHSVQWDFTFHANDVKQFGVGTAKKL
ncbi:MAG: hypothetical protein FWD90_12190 [Defluviitaleaceae bacterium]|nr:hypothetical protein [Defluviitaleaceae bacterium]